VNWLPSFLNPWSALLAAAVAVPALLLLYFLKLRRKEHAVASTLLWKKAIQDLQVNAPFQKLRRNLLLLLQLLILLALILALSRPISKLAARAGKLTVVLIDRSASMSATDPSLNGRTRLDEAKRQARELVGTMGRDAAMAVIAFDDSASVLQQFTSDGQALRSAIDSVQPTDRRSRLKLAYQLAEAQATFVQEQLRPNQKPDVFLLSDGRVADATELTLAGNLTFNPIGSPATGNVAVVAMSAKRNYERPNEVQVFARLANYGPVPVETPVDLLVSPIDPNDPGAKPQFKVRSAARVSLAPERWDDPAWVEANPGQKDESYVSKAGVEFTLDLQTAAIVRVEHKGVQGDVLAADDFASVVLPPPKALAVLAVTDGANPYLDRALASLNLKNFRTVTPEQYKASLPGDADVIVFDRFSPPQLPPAGNFLYLGGLPPASKLAAETSNGVPILEPDAGVLDWQRDHPILRGLALGKLYAAEQYRLQLPLEAEVLMDGVKGPMIVLYREGRQTHLTVAFDVVQSTWPLRPTFPAFLYNAMQYLALGESLAARQAFAPGDAPRIPRANLARDGGGEEITRVTLNGPGASQSKDVPKSGDFALPALDRTGVYTLDPPVPQFEQLAVNLTDDVESNLMPAAVAPGNIGQVQATGGGVAKTELWWWILACVGLPLLMVEWWVYTRRVHL